MEKKVKCKREDLDFGRECSLFCGREFTFDEENVYLIVMPDYFGETEKKYYYMICPDCGNYNVIDERLIPEQIKDKIARRMLDNPSLYQENLEMANRLYLTFTNNLSNRALIRKRIQEISK